MRDRYGADPARWPKWGEVHTAPFRHPLARAFDLPEVKRGGGTTVFAAVGANLKSTHGASFREVLDLADWDNSVATNVPGQSGQPGSPFYGNLLPLWGAATSTSRCRITRGASRRRRLTCSG
jgi:penicillin amidase